MAQPYIGEIRCFGFSFAPRGWAFCNGQLLSIADNTPLYTILGTNYGGDGQATFGLPNLQGQIPMHWGNGTAGLSTVLGEVAGVSSVSLLTSNLPVHTHTIASAIVAPGGLSEHSASPSGTALIGPSNPDAVYVSTAPTMNAQFSANAISITGGSQPHDNMQPYLAVNFCIALEGIYPSQN